jgi:hypothetical protein
MRSSCFKNNVSLTNNPYEDNKLLKLLCNLKLTFSHSVAEFFCIVAPTVCVRVNHIKSLHKSH